MSPKWHIILGFIASIIIFLSGKVHLIFILLFFISSFLLDADHYFSAVFKTGEFGIKNSLYHYERLKELGRLESLNGIRKKGPLHLFHTIEFFIVILALSICFKYVFFILLGMLFHIIADILYDINKGILYHREYFFTRWLFKQIQKGCISTQ